MLVHVADTNILNSVELLIISNFFLCFRIMGSDPDSLADQDRYKDMYDLNMQILGNIGVVKNLTNFNWLTKYNVTKNPILLIFTSF